MQHCPPVTVFFRLLLLVVYFSIHCLSSTIFLHYILTNAVFFGLLITAGDSIAPKNCERQVGLWRKV